MNRAYYEICNTETLLKDKLQKNDSTWCYDFDILLYYLYLRCLHTVVGPIDNSGSSCIYIFM